MKVILLFLTLCMSGYCQAKGVVIVHPSNGADISIRDVKRIFLGQKGAFSDGESAIPITLAAGNPIRESFNRNVLNKTEARYVAHWSKMLFTGNGTPPEEIESEQDLKALVSFDPSAIGIIDEALVDGSVKVVTRF